MCDCKASGSWPANLPIDAIGRKKLEGETGIPFILGDPQGGSWGKEFRNHQKKKRVTEGSTLASTGQLVNLSPRCRNDNKRRGIVESDE
jgi:hypothetical protein